MKTYTLFPLGLTLVFVLAAFNMVEQRINKDPEENDEDLQLLHFSLSSSCQNTISLERIRNAKTLADLVPDYLTQLELNSNVTTVKDLRIGAPDEFNLNDLIKTNGNELSIMQRGFLSSQGYSSNISLEGYIVDAGPNKNPDTDRYFNYCLTVVPEHEATYQDGSSALINYIRAESLKGVQGVRQEKLELGKLVFTVSKRGKITNANLESSCGYDRIDSKVIKLINQLPRSWNPAIGADGENVDQTFVISFGRAEGC